MKKIGILLIVSGLLPATAAAATSFSFTGTLPTAQDVFEVSFVISTTSNLQFRSYGFGGGTNGASTVIAPGGFDPLISLFSGAPANATIYTVAGGDPAADGDTLSSSISFVGNCGPAGTVTIGTDAVCGDPRMTLLGVPAGLYTLVLTDANYFPAAVNPGPPVSTALSDGFVDLTGGVFQTCDTNSASVTTCISPTGNWALDIIDGSEIGTLTITPEPGTWALLALGLAGLAYRRKLALPVSHR